MLVLKTVASGFFGGAVVLHLVWLSVGPALDQSCHGEWWLCPALCCWSRLLHDEVVPYSPGDGIATQEEVSSLSTIWDYTLSLPAC